MLQLSYKPYILITNRGFTRLLGKKITKDLSTTTQFFCLIPLKAYLDNISDGFLL